MERTLWLPERELDARPRLAGRACVEEDLGHVLEALVGLPLLGHTLQGQPICSAWMVS